VSLATPEDYCDVFDRLESDGVRYVVTSGVAVVLHGYVRSTVDLDIVVDAAPDDAGRALNALVQLGFVPSIPLPLQLVSVMRLFDHSTREVDLFTRYSIPFAELWAGSWQVQVGGSVARVISLEHLLRVKRSNGRPHDLLDLAGLQAMVRDDGAEEENPTDAV
jgi:hypothetical protein